MRYMAPSRNGLTGLGKGRAGGVAAGLSGDEKRGRGKGGVCIALESEVEVLGYNETSVTGIKDLLAEPTGLNPRGSSLSSD